MIVKSASEVVDFIEAKSARQFGSFWKTRLAEVATGNGSNSGTIVKIVKSRSLSLQTCFLLLGVLGYEVKIQKSNQRD